MLGFLLYFIFSFSVAQAQTDQVLTLPSCGKLNTLWKTRYHKALKVSWKVKDIFCKSPSRDRAFAEAAYILENTQFNLTNLPPGFPRPPRNMLSFVTSKYHQIRIIEGESPWTDRATKTLYFMSDIGKQSGFSVIGNLIHEARHAESHGHLHVICNDGPFKGEFMCDPSLGYDFDQAGPHTNAVLYFAWGAKRSNWSKQWKEVFYNLALKLVQSRINAPTDSTQYWIKAYLDNL